MGLETHHNAKHGLKTFTLHQIKRGFECLEIRKGTGIELERERESSKRIELSVYVPVSYCHFCLLGLPWSSFSFVMVNNYNILLVLSV